MRHIGRFRVPLAPILNLFHDTVHYEWKDQEIAMLKAEIGRTRNMLLFLASSVSTERKLATLVRRSDY